MEFTKPLQFGAIIIASTTLLMYTNILPSTLGNVVLVLLFSLLYFLFTIKRDGLSLRTLIPITISISLVIINKDPALISLVLLWILYDIHNNTTYNTQKIAKSFFFTGVTGYLFTIGAYLLIGLNKHADLEMWRINKLITRSSLGFQQPNTSMMYALAIVMSLIIAYKMTWIKSTATLAVIFGLYHYNQSRTAFILIILVILMNQLTITWPWPKLVFIGTGILSYILLVIPINPQLNNILSGRLSLYQSYTKSLGIHILANPLTDNTMLDNSYIQMLLSKGILFTIVFAVSLLYIVKTKSKLSQILFLAYILSAFTETTFLHFDLLFPVLLVSNTAFKGEKHVNQQP